jgi:hypothetical protein
MYKQWNGGDFTCYKLDPRELEECKCIEVNSELITIIKSWGGVGEGGGRREEEGGGITPEQMEI